MGAKQEAQEWPAAVRKYGERNGVTYEEIGGINPKDAPVALCVGGSNRLTGQLVEGFWGASCDADEREIGGFLNKARLPTALPAKAHMPARAAAVPAVNVESCAVHEAGPRRSSRHAESESLRFTQRQ